MFSIFRTEFSYTHVHLQARHDITFVVALIGTSMFPRERGRITNDISYVARVLFRGVNGKELTLVPIGLVEIFRTLVKYKRGEAIFFEGFNLLLWMLTTEYFHRRTNMDEICFSNSIHINNFYDKTRRFVFLVGTDELLFLNS